MTTVFAAALALGSAAGSPAQDWAGNGRLEGKVLGPDDKPVAGATVTLANQARGGGPTVKTDKKGKWAYMGIVAGKWDIDIAAPGFATRAISVTLPYESSRLDPIEVKLDKAAPAGPAPELLAAVKTADEAYKAGRFEEALTAYQKVLEQRPDLATTIHQQMGFSLIQLKRYPEGLEHLQKVIEAEPANMQIRAIAAQAALEGGMMDRGLELLKGLDEGAIKSPDVYFNIGVNFINANRPEDAITYFGKAIAMEAGYADGYFRRGLAYVQLGKNAEAKADLQTFVQLQPTGPQADLARKALEQLK